MKIVGFDQFSVQDLRVDGLSAVQVVFFCVWLWGVAEPMCFGILSGFGIYGFRDLGI